MDVFGSDYRDRALRLHGIDIEDSYRQLQLEVRVGGPIYQRLLGRLHQGAGLSPHLFPREIDVLVAVANGNLEASVASLLGISRETVRTHLGNTRRKLAARNTTHAVALAIREGLLPGFEGGRRPKAPTPSIWLSSY